MAFKKKAQTSAFPIVVNFLYKTFYSQMQFMLKNGILSF